MVTHYVEDYDGEKNKDAAEPLALTPLQDGYTAKVVEPEEKPKAAKKTARAKTKA